MALSADEADTAFQELSSAVRKVNMAWILEQVEDTIALGKQEPISESAARKFLSLERRARWT
jgi:hypothetical protein